MPLLAAAESLRIATFNTELNRRGPGLLLRDILSGEDAQVAAVVAVLLVARADVILLTGVDYDHGGAALAALADALAAAGQVYPHRFALRPNTGMTTGLDLDGDGRRGGPRDAQGYGRFAGEGGMALLSRLPVDEAGVRDFSTLFWHDLPGALLPPGMRADALAVQRLSTTGHWEVPLILPGGGRLRLLAWHATPPVFDGPEDRNGRRNHDEAALWLRLMEGRLPMRPPEPPFVLLGDANLDPRQAGGRSDALKALLAHPLLQDPAPRGTGPDPLATADFSARDGPGWLRVDYVLPSAGLTVLASGLARPPPGAGLRHAPVWAEITLPGG